MDLNADIIDVRDLIEHFEELETLFDDIENDVGGYVDEDDEEEFETIKVILSELAGCGGDEQWRGDWYPVTLIRDDYFEEYAENLVKDIGDLPQEIPSYIEIDWSKTAENIQQDYSSTEIFGTDYWYR